MKGNNLTIIGVAALCFAIGILVGSYGKSFAPKEKTIKPVEISQSNSDLNNKGNTSVSAGKKSVEVKQSAPASSSSSQGQGNEKVSFSKYTNYIEYCIRKNWRKVQKDVNEDFSMDFNVGKDGKIISYGILIPSKSKDFQEKAIKAVIESTPLEPIPDELGKDIIGYQIHFRGNDMNLASYSKVSNLTNVINYKFIKKKPVKIADAKDVRTMSSYPSKYRNVNIALQVQRNWNPPLDEDSRVQVKYDINQQGEVTNIRVIAASGSQQAQDAAINALKNVKAANVSEYMSDLGYWFYVEPFR